MGSTLVHMPKKNMLIRESIPKIVWILYLVKREGEAEQREEHMDRFKELVAIHLHELMDEKRHLFLTRAFEGLSIRRQMQLGMDPVECTLSFALLSVGKNDDEEDPCYGERLCFSRAMLLTRQSRENEAMGLTLELDGQVETFVNQAVTLVFFKAGMSELYVEALTLLHEMLKTPVARPLAKVARPCCDYWVEEASFLIDQGAAKRLKRVHFEPLAFEAVPQRGK